VIRIFILGIFFRSFVFAAVDAKLIGIALEDYLTGKYEAAYKASKKLYDEAPENPKVRNIHRKVLVKMALLREDENKLKEALSMITAAEEIKRTDESAKIKKRILSKLRKAKQKKKIEKRQQPKKKSEIKKRKVRKTSAVAKTKKGKAKKEKAGMKPQKKKALSGKIRYPSSLFIISSLNLLGLIFLSYFVAVAFSKRKEEKLIEEERRIAQIVETLGNKSEYRTILQNQKEIMSELMKIPEETEVMRLQNAEILRLIERLTRGAASTNIEMPADSERAGITGVDDKARVRADTVEIIAEMFKDSPIIEDMLEPYLHDMNNRVLANACKALFPHNRRRALEIVRRMAAEDNVWMRLSAAWVCGELATSECVKILTPLLNDTSQHVRKRTVLSFEKLKEKGIEIPIAVAEKIDEIKMSESQQK